MYICNTSGYSHRNVTVLCCSQNVRCPVGDVRGRIPHPYITVVPSPMSVSTDLPLPLNPLCCASTVQREFFPFPVDQDPLCFTNTVYFWFRVSSAGPMCHCFLSRHRRVLLMVLCSFYCVRRHRLELNLDVGMCGIYMWNY